MSTALLYCAACIPYPSSADVQNEWSYTCTPSIRLHCLHMDRFTFCGICDMVLIRFVILQMSVG
jgi:hypothetical protein